MCADNSVFQSHNLNARIRIGIDVSRKPKWFWYGCYAVIFKDIDIWRLGGNVPESLDALGESILEWRDRPIALLGRTQYEKGREFRVADAENPAGDGFPSISAAVAAAAPGDTIIVAPGVYAENLRIDAPGLTISSPPGTETSVPVTILGASTVLDLSDTLWRGVAFTNRESDAPVALVDFTGRFEGKGTGREAFAVSVAGGNPVFHASTFSGAGGMCVHAANTLSDSALPNTEALFTYCLIEDFTEGVLIASGDINVRFANCVLTRKRHHRARRPGLRRGGGYSQQRVFSQRRHGRDDGADAGARSGAGGAAHDSVRVLPVAAGGTAFARLGLVAVNNTQAIRARPNPQVAARRILRMFRQEWPRGYPPSTGDKTAHCGW